jgi:hypothetical protein
MKVNIAGIPSFNMSVIFFNTEVDWHIDLNYLDY